ncbi:MAG: PKD domain-containing protein [Flavobacteriales bacterium]|nr:PKD domain-containing protein [Flavobacteriales bacterium]
MKKLLLILLCLPMFGFGQNWVDKMQDPTINFYDIQKDFEEYWENRVIEKGKGWKQFKRWENFIEQRVFPDGIQHPDILFEEYNSLRLANNQYRMAPTNVWSQVGPDNVPLESSGRKRGIGRVNSIVFHPTNPNIIYIGAPAGGFWKSLNGGQTWSTSTDFLTNLGVSDIAIHPNNPDTLFIITGDRDGGDTYSYGLMKSFDGGATFITTGLSFNITQYYRGNRVLIDPNNPDNIIVATSNGIYRSADAGITFVHTFSSVNITSMEFHPTNSNIIYGGSKGNTSVYKSTDNGVTWNQAGIGLPTTNNVVRVAVAVTDDNPSVVYALFGDNNNGFYGIYKSTDEGVSWIQQANSPNLLGWSANGSDSGGQAWYDLALTVSPLDEDVLFVGGVNCWKSIDGGQNWNLNTHWYGGGGANYMHADEHMLEYNPLNNYVYSANDGGLYFSSNHGNNWTDISDGLHITQFYSLGVSQTVQDKVITGSQDNGTFLKTNLNWDAVIGGDGMECIIDYLNSNTMYGALYYGDIRKSTNGGNSFSTISSGNGAWETPYVLDRNDPNIIYVGYDELEKSTDGGNSWNTITNNQTNGGKIDEIAVSKSDPSVIYFSDGPNIFKTSDGGNTWINITGSLPYKTISYIIVHPADENKIWITLSGYTTGEKVYHSSDGGTSWQNISGTLPNIPANCIVLDENTSTQTLYIGTDLGVFTTDSTLTDWNLFNNNSLPNVIVTELEIQYQSNILYASTYGRGLWNIDLQITSPPIANFIVSDSVFCNTPATVSFTNTSSYSNTYVWDFGDGNSSTSANPTHTYLNYGTYSVSLIANGPLGTDSIIYQSIISIDPANSCIITLPPSGAGVTQTGCNGTLFDVGGPNSNYYDNNNSWITISPSGSNQITLNFISFDVEAPSSSTYCNWDYLEVFDGGDTSAPSLGQFCNALTGSPGTLVSTGGEITVYLHADAAVNGTGFEADWSCNFPALPPTTDFLVSDTISCDGSVSFTDLSTNGPISWNWDFGDGNTSTLQNPTHVYLNGGVYSITLITSNQYGSDTLFMQNYIDVISAHIVLQGDTACVGASLLLQANSSSAVWYSDSLANNLVGSGLIFQTPILNNTTSYFARSEINYPIIFGGPPDNTFGGGGYYQGNRHLIFDNYKPSALVSVLVYSNSSAYRIIELRNSSNAVLADTNIYIPSSPSGVRVYLNFDLPVENNMQLGINGSNSDLFRNDASAIFPYNISDIVSITGTNASAGYYYFFYDWEVQKSPCYSNMEKVDAVIEINSSSYNNITVCDSVVWNGTTYTISGTYYDSTFTNSNGCDSVITLDLTINNPSTSTDTQTSCSSYTWIDGVTYTTSNNTATYITTNSNGCDSVITLDLTINNPSTSTDTQTSCSSYTWIDGVTYTTSNNTATYITTNSNGCDSVITLDLTINNPSTSTDTQTSCSSYTWIDGVTYTTSNNTATYITTNSNGCDSVITLDLTITGNPIATVSQVGLDLDASVVGGNTPYSYQWNTTETTQQITPTANGTYWVIVADVNQCISDTIYFNVTWISTDITELNIVDLSIYPNPSEDVFNITFTSEKKQNIEIRIFNGLGERVFVESKQQFFGEYTKQIDLKETPKAIYFLEIETEKGIINKKLILQ